MVRQCRVRFLVALARADLLLFAKHLFVAVILAGPSASHPLVVLTPCWDLFVSARNLFIGAKPLAAGESGDDEYDKFSLPTGPGLPENILEGCAHRLITDVELGRAGPKCSPCQEMKCQSGLGRRQVKVAAQ